MHKKKKIINRYAKVSLYLDDKAYKNLQELRKSKNLSFNLLFKKLIELYEERNQ